MIDQNEYGNVLMEHTKQIVALQESLKSYHHRLDDINKLTKSVHELAINVEKMAVEVNANTQTTAASIEALQASAKDQGKRLGSIENDIRDLKQAVKSTEKNTERLDKVEREPAEKWKSISFTAITVFVTAVITYIISRVFNG